jgi:vancomycin resistance protein YoaR
MMKEKLTKLPNFFKSFKKFNFKNIDFQRVKNILLILYTVLFISTVYHFIYATRIIPGVRIAGIKVGGMTFSQARDVLTNKEQKTTKELKLTFENQEFLIRAQEVGLIYDWDATVSRAFEVGRTGNLILDTKDKIAGLFKSLYVPASYDYDESSLAVKFSIIKGEVNKDVIPSTLVLSQAGDLTVTSSQDGRKVVDEGLYSYVVGAFDRLDFSDINIPTKVVTPQVNEKDVAQFLPVVKDVISNDLTVTYGDKSWVFDKQQLLDLISFEKNGSTVKINLNKAKFGAYIEQISAEVNELPRGQVTALADNSRVLEFKITRDGKDLDVAKFMSDFKNSMFGTRQPIQLAVNAVTGQADKSKYGIFALIGEGTSHFAHSIPNRVHNIALASERTNGVLVAPGATYSLNDSIGEITAKTGYYPAYIIAGGRTVLGDGGGVCQVSTTMFRAVLNAGLPVVMRYPHAYRVGYYEQDMPVGFDASVFQPSWDFKFKNDTSAYVLIQTSVDPVNYVMSFRIYGTPDGRTVEISQPAITNQSPPPAPLYQDDPTLPVGVTQQVEFPAWGAHVVFTRTVKRGAEILYTDTFSSSYQPWRAVYLVGTKK